MIPNEAEKQPGAFRSETEFWLGLLTTILFLLFGSTWLAGLTIPAVPGISLLTGRVVELGLEATDIVLLLLTMGSVPSVLVPGAPTSCRELFI